MHAFFFFNDPATTEIYTLSLHDALPICLATRMTARAASPASRTSPRLPQQWAWPSSDRKSTRLNSSHTVISYAVFCLKKKKKKNATASPGPQATATHKGIHNGYECSMVG